MMRVLFLTPQLPYPPHQGTTLRNLGLIEGLAERHAVTLLSLAEPDQPPLERTPLPALCERAATIPAPTRSRAGRLRDLLAGRADMACRLWSENYADALERLLCEAAFDVVHVEGIEMAPYLPIVERNASDALLIYDAHNAEYALQQRIALADLHNPSRWPFALYSLIQWRRLARFEADVCRRVGHVLAVSEADARALRALPHTTPISVLPNAIQVESYRPEDTPPASVPHPALVFTGKMDFRPNVDAALWFAGDILPLVRRQVPDAHFIVVGQKPHPRLRALDGQPGVVITGRVADIQPYLAAADVYVAPLRMGSGTRLKLLEAMAMARPIVSTTLGAEGFDLSDGQQIRLAERPDCFARAIVELLGDPQRRAALGRAGRAFVQDNYDWPALIPKLEAVYESHRTRRA
jgi:sugar transferase (PEP-CTERM/EpsH1 system associated)